MPSATLGHLGTENCKGRTKCSAPGSPSELLPPLPVQHNPAGFNATHLLDGLVQPQGPHGLGRHICCVDSSARPKLKSAFISIVTPSVPTSGHCPARNRYWELCIEG